MKDLTKNPYGKYNGNEQDYVLKALDRETPENKSYSWTTKLEEKFCQEMGINMRSPVTQEHQAYMRLYLLWV